MKVYIAEKIYSTWNSILKADHVHYAIDSIFLDKEVAKKYIEAKDKERKITLQLFEYEVKDMPL